MTPLARDIFEARSEPRDAVFHRAHATLADHRRVPIVVVNLSPHGFMARADAAIGVGEWVRVTLPVAGVMTAAVRWSLGGRIGCEFERAIDLRDYALLLAAVQA